METLHVGRSSGEAEASPDPSWRGLYRAGGVSAVLWVVLAGVVPVVLSFITPLPPTSSGEFASLAGGVATLQYIASNRSVFILNQVLFFGPGVLVIVVFLALYMALKHLNKRFAPKVPGDIIAVVIMTIASALMHLESYGITVVGAIPSGSPQFSLPELHLADMWSLLPSALIPTLIVFTDAVLTERSFAQKQAEKASASFLAAPQQLSRATDRERDFAV